jgi:hemolysin III
VGGIAAVPLLVIAASRRGSAADVVAAAVFGASLILLYFASTVYHAAPPGRIRDRLRRLDHAAIYLLIAGTYTPFTLGVLAGPWGWSLFAVVWSLAALGVAAKLAVGPRFPRLSTALYLAMGWIVVVAAGPLADRIHPAGLAWLAAGGLCYTVGVVFYASRRIPWGHFIWHLFVLAGSTCHFFAALWYAAA